MCLGETKCPGNKGSPKWQFLPPPLKCDTLLPLILVPQPYLLGLVFPSPLSTRTPTALKQEPAMRNQETKAYQWKRFVLTALMALAFTNICLQDKKFPIHYPTGKRIYISPHTSAFCPWCWCFIVPATWTRVCKNFPLQTTNKQLLWLLLGRKRSVTVQYQNTPLQVLSMSSVLYNSTIITIQNFPRPFWNRN